MTRKLKQSCLQRSLIKIPLVVEVLKMNLKWCKKQTNLIAWTRTSDYAWRQTRTAFNKVLGLKRRVQDLEVKNESAEEFSREKPQKIIVSGASHLKSISQGKLINTTGKTIEVLKAYCSRDDWLWAWKPDVSISSVLLQQMHSRATHLVMSHHLWHHQPLT